MLVSTQKPYPALACRILYHILKKRSILSISMTLIIIITWNSSSFLELITSVLLSVINTNSVTSMFFLYRHTFVVSRSSSKTPLHTNPYARGEGADGHYSTGQISSDDALRRVPRGGWQEESWRGRESLPMGHISTRPRSPSWQHDISEWPSYIFWTMEQ